MRRQTGFALDSFLIRKLQVMDVFFEETDWLCSPGTSFAPLGESHGEGTNTQTDTQTDIATTRKNRPKGQFFENFKSM